MQTRQGAWAEVYRGVYSAPSLCTVGVCTLPVVEHQEAKKHHRPRLRIDTLSFLPHSTGQSKSQDQQKFYLLMEQLRSRTENDEDAGRAHRWDHFCN